YAMNITLQGLKPPTLHNGNGLITYGLAGFSYYYSRTRMALSGTLVDHKQSLQVTGEAWMDHQWGNFLTLGGGGWDWFSIQLNNEELVEYQSTGNSYWEGAVYIQGQSGGAIVKGEGYVELTGYAHG